MIALDTTAIIDIFKKNFEIKELLENLNDQFVSTIMNYQELVFGLDFDNQKHKLEEEYYDDFFQEVFIFSHDIVSAKKGAELYRQLRKKGKDVEKFDCMIAGILLSNNVNKIITRNVKHFSEIPGLKVISY